MSTTKRLSALIAPGQGSQRPGLYKLTESIGELGETYELGDEISIELFGQSQIEGRSLSQLARDATQEELAVNTVITQPLIVATSIGLIKYLKKQESYTTAYGHSLGELAALYAAGCISERDAIGLAMLRGVYSREASQQQPSGMAVLLNIPHEVKEKIKFGEEEGVVIATDNNPDQFTIAGYKEKVDDIVSEVVETYQRVRGLSKEEKRLLPNALKMKIGGGFHSFIMRPAQKSFRKALDSTTITPPTEMNYFSNHSHNYEGRPDVIREHLESQLIHPVLFWHDIGCLIVDGHVRIVESGPGSILVSGLRQQQSKGRLPENVEFLAAESDILDIAA